MPVVNIDKLIKEELGSRRKRAPQEDDWDFSEFETETLVENEDMSVTKYPAPYCDQVRDPGMCPDGDMWKTQYSLSSTNLTSLQRFITSEP